MSIHFDPSIMTIQSAGGTTNQPKATTAVTDGKFAELLAQGVEAVNNEVIASNQQVEKLVETQGANIHETMVALEKADIAMRLSVKISQKLVQAYQEVSRMQV